MIQESLRASCPPLEDARAGQGECPGTACNSGRDAMPLDIFEGVQ
jgi:hypothetical protein